MPVNTISLTRPPAPTRPPRARQADIYLLLDVISDLRGALANVSAIAGVTLRLEANFPGQVAQYMQQLADSGDQWDRCGRRTTDMYAEYGHHGS